MVTTSWPMTNIFNPWPVYTNGISNVIAVKIQQILPHIDGSITIVPEGDYDAVYEPQMFVTTFAPVAGGYLVRDSDNQDLYMSAANFDGIYTAVPRGEPGRDGTRFSKYTVSGNMPANYPDSPGASGAHGNIGTAMYWKITMQCTAAPVGSSVIASVDLNKNAGMPCDADGNAVPYSILVNQIHSLVASPSVEIYLIIYGAATQLCSMSTKTMTTLRTTSAGSGSDPEYLLTYWYPNE